MTPSETQRFRLRDRLGELMEDDDVRTLMESLPPVDWHELATKEDLTALEGRVGVRFDAVDVELRAVDVRIDALRVELGARIDAVDVRIDAVGDRIDTGLTKVRGEMKLGLARQTYVILAGMAAIITPIYIALFSGAGG